MNEKDIAFAREYFRRLLENEPYEIPDEDIMVFTLSDANLGISVTGNEDILYSLAEEVREQYLKDNNY